MENVLSLRMSMNDELYELCTFWDVENNLEASEIQVQCNLDKCVTNWKLS